MNVGTGPPASVAIIAYPGAQEAAVLGLTDLLEVAGRLATGSGAGVLRAKSSGAARLQVDHVRVEAGLGAPSRPWAAVILPPSLHEDPPPFDVGPLVAWLRGRHREGTLLCSVCAGAFLLAETGLLDARPATTHWALGAQFQARFPSVRLDTDRLLIDDGDVLTAGGLMAWSDLGLALVARFLGPATLLATARYFLIDPGGREQRFYTTFAPNLSHGDETILAVQRWLQSRSAHRVSVADMAGHARLGERTFLRRFRKATGMAPKTYLQHLRTGKGRDLLERSKRSVDEIAWEVGYEDPGAFRKVFAKIVGISPGEYRRRFAVTHP